MLNPPEKCPSCDEPLIKEGVHLVCKNKDCSEQQILKIVHWCVSCDMDGVGEATIRKLYEEGVIKNIKDLYDLKAEDMTGIEGFGSKTIANIIRQIQYTNKMTLGQFCDKLNIPLVGEKAIRKIGLETIEDLLNFKGGNYVIENNLKEFIEKNLDLINELLECVEIIKSTPRGIIKVAITGNLSMKRIEFENMLSNYGIEVGGITKETKYLICNSVAEEIHSSKGKKAKELGIEIISEAEFLEKFEVDILKEL